MKKTVTLTLMLLMCAAGILAEEKKTCTDIDFSVPLTFESQTVSGETLQSDMVALAFGLQSRSMLFSDLLGVYTSMDLTFPLRLTYTSSSGISVGVNRSAYDLLLGIDALMGLAIVPVRTGAFRLAVAPGLHYTILFATASSGGTESSSISIALGAGLSVCAEYHFTDIVYMTGGLEVAYDFIGFSSGSSGKSSTLTIQPRIGIGLKH